MENGRGQGVFRVKLSQKLETNIKQNAFIRFMLKEQGFQAIRLMHHG